MRSPGDSGDDPRRLVELARPEGAEVDLVGGADGVQENSHAPEVVDVQVKVADAVTDVVERLEEGDELAGLPEDLHDSCDSLHDSLVTAYLHGVPEGDEALDGVDEGGDLDLVPGVNILQGNKMIIE